MFLFIRGNKKKNDTEQSEEEDNESSKSIVSNNFYGEILFDYLIAHYENSIYTVGKVQELLNDAYINDPRNVTEYENYYESVKVNK